MDGADHRLAEGEGIIADWYGSARSNYFRVKDLEAFTAAVSKCEVEIVNRDRPQPGWSSSMETTTPGADPHPDGFIALLSTGDKGGWETSYYRPVLDPNDEDAEDEYVEFDIPTIVAPHLIDGDVAVFMECGAEKLRYITGFAEAVNNKGERRHITLSSIHDLAKELGPNVTDTSY